MAGTERTDIAASEARRLLGVAEISEHALFTLARRELGEDRAAACLALARLAPLSRRSMATGAVAALIVGTRALGIRWWTSAHDERLRADGLEALGGVIADAAADAEWGAPIGFVDLNHPATDDRVKVPTGAKAGDRLIAAWDAGGRVAVRVVDRGGFLGSRLEEHWYHDAAEVAWAWSIATNTRPIRLPGEVVGEPSDPFAAPLDPAVARRLVAWLARHEVTGFTWRTKADLWTAWCELSTSRRAGAWLEFDRAVRAVVDG